MKFRKSLLAVLCVASLGVISVPITASAATGIYFNIEPPPPRQEVVPAPRRGYVWAPGYWDARGQRHVWRAGHWERQRRGYHYIAPTWTQRDNRWELQRGRWNRGDRDGDGVPNAADRAPSDPTRR
ncbi:YXWGXW repeat-containing protein [Rhodoferax sp. UBA5149]|uniref:YXWGXW repeat-containing protein n=1 Tax=Rhodoferax sp. UBA5149 TaxID=1947379 RepID=UPI0025DFF024|nr:YXWGXW repeat-containing protein [Rhodoferax sp. UBA5149]